MAPYEVCFYLLVSPLPRLLLGFHVESVGQVQGGVGGRGVVPRLGAPLRVDGAADVAELLEYVEAHGTQEPLFALAEGF